jgi:hypothetical protein
MTGASSVMQLHRQAAALFWARPWRHCLWLLSVFLLFWLTAIRLPLRPFFPALDSSWLGALSYFAAKRLQYGTEVIFAYGPLAYLGTDIYSGYLFRERVIWELGFKAISAGFFCWVITRLPRVWSTIYLIFCVLFVLTASPEVFYFFSMTILVVFLLRGSARVHPADVLATMAIAAVSLMKYNYLVLVLLGIGASTATALLKRSFGRAAWISCTFLIGFLLCWKWAGQDFRNLGSYIRNAQEISFGYKESMGRTASSDLVVILGLVALALVFVQLVFITIGRCKLGVILIALFSASEMVLDWQHGFIRADGHVVTFFALCPAAMVSIWATGAIDQLPKWPLYFSAAAIGYACLAGMYAQDSVLVLHDLGGAAKQIQSGWNFVFHEAGIERELERKLVEQKAKSSLLRVKNEVGQASIDVLGYEQASALLNGLNYTPRPIFQGYSAYTPRLIAENLRFYRSVRAPTYALVKYQTIDNRYPALDDAGPFKELIYNYALLFTEKDYSLWKKLPQKRETRGIGLAKGTTTFEEEVTVPQNGIIWLELKIQKSVLGKIVNILYKSPMLYIALKSKDGAAVRYRIISSMVASGFMISPSVLTHDDLIATSRGSNHSVPASFAVSVSARDRKFFQDTIRYRMELLPQLPKQEATAALSGINSGWALSAEN